MTELDGTETEEEKEVLIIGGKYDAVIGDKLVCFKDSLKLRIGIVNDYSCITRADLSFSWIETRFPQGGPGTIIERNRKKFVVTKNGSQRRID